MKRHFLPIVFFALAGAGLLMAAKVITDYDHAADFGRYHTYSWLGVKAGNDLWNDRIRQSVDGQLSAKGWQKVESNGDAALAAVERTRDQRTVQTFYDGFGGGWGWRGWGPRSGIATRTVEHTPVGTLIVDVFDGSSKKLVWRGQATQALSDNPEKTTKKLQGAIEDMFKRFPPKEKS